MTRRVVGTDRDELAALMLDAYRGTIDDEGESLDSLVSEGVSCVGATITDGNIASERLFLGLGFTRRGSWG